MFNKKIFFFALSLIFIQTFLCNILCDIASQEHQRTKNKKQLLILTSKGGFGHMAACDSLQSTLGEEYDITIVNPFEEIIEDLDIIKKITLKKMDGEQFYNKILSSGWINFFNFNARHIVPFTTKRMSKLMEKRFLNYLKKTMPDLLISVIPVITLPASNAAWRLRIPYLMITLDYDLTMWLIGIKKAKHQNITITVADDYTKEKFLTKKLPNHINKIHSIGVPIRKSFFDNRDLLAIKKEWQIPIDKPIVMILMGGAGSAQAYHFFKELAQFENPIHILVCMGRSTLIEKNIKKIHCNENVTYSCIPFTKKIPDLMAVSDLLITKPGPGTVTEAMLMKCPVLLDRTITTLFWEKKVFNLVRRHGIGDEIKSLSSLNKIVEGILYNSDKQSNIKNAFKKIKTYNFDKDIKKIIESLCNQKLKPRRQLDLQPPLHSELPFLRGCRPSSCYRPELHLMKNYHPSHPKNTLIHELLGQSLVV